MAEKILTIILNYNNYEDTAECLESLAVINDPDLSVLVVDNSSADGSGERLAVEFPQFKFIFAPKNLGFAGGNNFGISEGLKGNYDYYFLLNNDTVVEPDIFQKFRIALNDPGLKNCGSWQAKMIWYYHRQYLDTAGLAYSRNGLGFNRGAFGPVAAYNRAEEVIGACAGAAFYRRTAVEEMIKEDGYFLDPRFFAYEEDMDLAFRLQWRGWRCYYLPDCRVYHKSGQTSKHFFALKFFWISRNREYFIWKNLPGRFILKNILWLGLRQAIYIATSFKKGWSYGCAAVRGKFSAWCHMGTTLKQRKIIQRQKDQWPRIQSFLILKWRVIKPKEYYERLQK